MRGKKEEAVPDVLYPEETPARGLTEGTKHQPRDEGEADNNGDGQANTDRHRIACIAIAQVSIQFHYLLHGHHLGVFSRHGLCTQV